MEKKLIIANREFQVDVIPEKIFWRLEAVYHNHEPYIMDDNDISHVASQIFNGIFTGVFEESPEYERQTWDEYDQLM